MGPCTLDYQSFNYRDFTVVYKSPCNLSGLSIVLIQKVKFHVKPALQFTSPLNPLIYIFSQHASRVAITW